jgi:hypothetical protein
MQIHSVRCGGALDHALRGLWLWRSSARDTGASNRNPRRRRSWSSRGLRVKQVRQAQTFGVPVLVLEAAAAGLAPGGQGALN